MNQTFEIETKALQAMTSKVAKVIYPPSQIPILRCALFIFDGVDVLSANATNLYVWVTTRAKVKANIQTSKRATHPDMKPKFCIDAKRIAKVARLIQPDQTPTVTLDIQDEHVILSWTSGNSRIIQAFKKQEPQDFPEMITAPKIWSRPIPHLAKHMKTVAPSISNEETRYYLNGEFCEIADTSVRLTATDGHTLISSERALEPADPAFAPFAGIIPVQAVKLIVDLFGKEQELAVSGYATPRPMLEFAAGDVTIVTRLIDGTFPEWRRVVPSEEAAKWRVNIGAPGLLSEHAAFLLAGLDKYNAYTLRFSFEEAATILSMQTHAGEQGRIVTDYAWQDISNTVSKITPPPTFAANAHYIRKLLAQCSGRVSLLLSEASAAILIVEEGYNDIRVIMPMRA